jgi:hypothetical protein
MTSFQSAGGCQPSSVTTPRRVCVIPSDKFDMQGQPRRQRPGPAQRSEVCRQPSDRCRCAGTLPVLQGPIWEALPVQLPGSDGRTQPSPDGAGGNRWSSKWAKISLLVL